MEESEALQASLSTQDLMGKKVFSEGEGKRRRKIGGEKTVKVEAHIQGQKQETKSAPAKNAEAKPTQAQGAGEGGKTNGEQKRSKRRRYYHGKPKAKSTGEG